MALITPYLLLLTIQCIHGQNLLVDFTAHFFTPSEIIVKAYPPAGVTINSYQTNVVRGNTSVTAPTVPTASAQNQQLISQVVRCAMFNFSMTGTDANNVQYSTQTVVVYSTPIPPIPQTPVVTALPDVAALNVQWTGVTYTAVAGCSIFYRVRLVGPTDTQEWLVTQGENIDVQSLMPHTTYKVAVRTLMAPGGIESPYSTEVDVITNAGTYLTTATSLLLMLELLNIAVLSMVCG